MKTRLNFVTLLTLGILVTLFSACVLAARGDGAATTKENNAKEKQVLVDLEKVKDRLSPGYRLAYQVASGDVLRTRVTHLVKVETKVKGNAQTTTSRTISTRAWRISNVDGAGNITFDNVVEKVEM